jgi:hypothetical protein
MTTSPEVIARSVLAACIVIVAIVMWRMRGSGRD